MKNVRIMNVLFTHFKKGEIIDMFTKEEVLQSNITDSAREWINTIGDFEGFCLSGYKNNDETIDYTGLWKEDIEEIPDNETRSRT